MTQKFCFECGTKAPSIAAKFCSSCGTSLDILGAKKSSPAKKIIARDIDDDDEDGSDTFEIPSLSALKAASKVRIEGDDEVGFNSFTFGADGFQPAKFTSTRR